jgi:hypothetical protein
MTPRHVAAFTWPKRLRISSASRSPSTSSSRRPCFVAAVVQPHLRRVRSRGRVRSTEIPNVLVNLVLSIGG